MAIIAIDGVKLSGKPCGLSNIALAIIGSLSQIGNHKVIIIMKAAPHPEIDQALKKHKNVKVIISPPAILKSISIFWSLFCINKIVKRINPDLYIAPNFLISPYGFNKKIKTVVFVHDLVIKEYPQTMHWFNRLHMYLLFKYSLKKADTIWCNSKYTALGLKKYYKTSIVGKGVFIGSGVGDEFQNIISNPITKHQNEINPDMPYILFVGNIEPRKNVLFLLNLYEKLYSKYNLIMVGSKGWGGESDLIQDYLNKNEYLSTHIKRLSNISTKQLIELYSSAEFLISTSLNEGLGLPLLEAMACSCPLIAPYNSAFIEIVDDVGVTVKTWIIDDWLIAIDLLTKHRILFVTKGIDKIKNYNWLNITGNFLKFVNIH